MYLALSMPVICDSIHLIHYREKALQSGDDHRTPKGCELSTAGFSPNGRQGYALMPQGGLKDPWRAPSAGSSDLVWVCNCYNAALTGYAGIGTLPWSLGELSLRTVWMGF